MLKQLSRIEGDSSAPTMPRLPQSPLTVDSSAPASPAISLFSATGHTRISSSVSSLVSGLGSSMESPSRTQLSGVKEEPWPRQSSELEDQYFEHFDYDMPMDDLCFSPIDTTDSYDLSDTGMDQSHSPKKRCSDSSMKGVSRISSHISIMSTRWKSKHASGGTEDGFIEDLQSRANSAASSALASPVMSPVSPVGRFDSQIPPSPARTIFEERISDSAVRPIDITRANSFGEDENDTLQATTPLLPPFMGDDPTSVTASRVQSPLQSPSVADVSQSTQYSGTSDPRIAGIPSPPLSSKPSVASFSRPRASTVRTISGEPTPFILSDPNDEWANKLGHANFTIQPEPYVPTTCDIDTFQQLRADWDIARCNYAKHLVRTGEHYGTTSNIYKLTEEKWEFISRQWRNQHDGMLNLLGSVDGVALTLTQSNMYPCEQVRIPRLHDNDKFPEMGDEDIVGPMTVASPNECSGSSLKKRAFFKFFRGLVSRS
ncbi:hypothetical protein N7474_003942 [Penicillium riverlandense]|uniref:uncharacterized protein n=1 Tax=Penicillium riverlandense TaxID=1903569 RepID=UPI002547B51F|nr:uncharacterized protein N7474_003942 [Penicillium riverlandense]KAJ5818351.1 hypothetical protein N7474_003942 [Penicillium riverlandense]